VSWLLTQLTELLAQVLKQIVGPPEDLAVAPAIDLAIETAVDVAVDLT
jgi:hypothetical protein